MILTRTSCKARYRVPQNTLTPVNTIITAIMDAKGTLSSLRQPAQKDNTCSKLIFFLVLEKHIHITNSCGLVTQLQMLYASINHNDIML